MRKNFGRFQKCSYLCTRKAKRKATSLSEKSRGRLRLFKKYKSGLLYRPATLTTLSTIVVRVVLCYMNKIMRKECINKVEWKPVVGFNGRYEVSNKGKVRSLHYRGFKRARIMKASKDGSGYLFVCLRKDGKYHLRKVHRLVYEGAFSRRIEVLRERVEKEVDKSFK